MMAQKNTPKINLCCMVILCAVVQEVCAAENETEKISDELLGIRTKGQNASIIYGPEMGKIKIVRLVFQYYYPTALVIVSFIFGVSLEIQKVIATLKRPYAPFISIFCNYIFSPLVSAMRRFVLKSMLRKYQLAL